MPNYKCTFIFNSAKVGWSEVYYATLSGMDQAGGRTSIFAAARAGLLSEAASIEAIRVSDEAIVGDSEVFFGLWAGGGNKGFNEDLIPDLPSAAWLCRATDAERLYRRQVWLRGMPDVNIAFNGRGEPVVPPDLRKKFQTFENVLTDGWQMRVLSKSAGDTQIKVISALGRTADNFWEITAVGHGLQTGDFIRVKNCRGTNVKTVNGVWMVTVTGVDKFWIPSPNPLTNVFIYTGGGKVVRRVIRFVDIKRLVLERVSNKKTGRAFFVSPGRRRRALR